MVGLGLIVVLGLIAVGLLYHQAKTAHTQVVVASIGVVGVSITAVGSLVGVLVKTSIDERAARLAEEAEANRKAEAENTAELAKLDTAIRAVDLLSTPDGSAAPGLRQAGALMALCFPPLEQLDLALALLSTTWRSGDFPTPAAVTIIDRALRSSSHATQSDAARLLYDQYDRLLTPDGRHCYWPETATRYPNELADSARHFALAALMGVLASRKVGDGIDIIVVNGALARLAAIRRNDPSDVARAGATIGLDAVLGWYGRTYERGLEIHTPNGVVDTSELAAEIEADVFASRGLAMNPVKASAEKISDTW